LFLELVMGLVTPGKFTFGHDRLQTRSGVLKKFSRRKSITTKIIDHGTSAGISSTFS
jgi:hypothetical protein